MYSRGGRECGGLRGWGRRSVREEVEGEGVDGEDVGGTCAASLWASASPVLPASPGGDDRRI